MASALAAFFLLLPLGTAVVSAQESANDEVPLESIELRDRLIATQESLLNTYRCQFDIDTHIVPNGCTDGAPTGGPILPTPFEGTPTQHALQVRDRLVDEQETLLNVYRCLFNVDTHIVPGGCPDPPPENPFTSVSVSSGHVCGIRADQSINCWGINSFGESISLLGQYSAVSPDGLYTCALNVDQRIECWGRQDHQCSQRHVHRHFHQLKRCLRDKDRSDRRLLGDRIPKHANPRRPVHQHLRG